MSVLLMNSETSKKEKTLLLHTVLSCCCYPTNSYDFSVSHKMAESFIYLKNVEKKSPLFVCVGDEKELMHSGVL